MTSAAMSGAMATVGVAYRLPMSVCIMPALQFLNHRWVPIDLRVLYMNGASLLWNAVLSHLVYAHTANPTTPKAGATATSR